MADIEKVIKDLEFCVNGHFKVELSLATKILALLKEQEAEIRQLKLALDIAKGTCKGIIVETDEKYMGDL